MPGRFLCRLIQSAAAATGLSACLAAAAAPADPPTIALIEIEETPVERPNPLAWLFGSGQNPTLRDIVGLLNRAAADSSVSGVVIRLREAPLSVTQAEELGRAIAHIRASGKKVHLFADSYSTPELLLGAHADEIVLQAGGGASFPGLYMEEMFLADTLEWAGIKADLVQVGSYKGANEEMTRTSPSPEWDQNINALLDGLYANMRSRLKSGRKLDDAGLDEAMRRGWMADASTAQQVGIIDAAVDLPDLSAHLESAYAATDLNWVNIEPDQGDAAELDRSNPLSIFAELFQEPEIYPERDTIAIVHIDGAIIDGDSTQGGFFGEPGVGSTTIRQILEELENEDLVKGVIIRINSPGGSATASEIIWQGLRRVAERKPVWTSVGTMAASGGYYIAVGSSRIYANESSILGSIGVVGGKMSTAGLYDKLKIRSVGRARGPMAHLLESSTPWTQAERDLVRVKMKETYDLFASRVAAGRPEMDLAATAEGRLFTGAAAVDRKMADRLGGLQETILDLAAELKLKEDQYDVLEYPGAASLMATLGESFGAAGLPIDLRRNSAAPTHAPAASLRPLADAARALVGERQWPAVRNSLGAMFQLRDQPVLLTSPTVIIVR